jgi:uncharacterized protein (DUF2236 family)
MVIARDRETHSGSFDVRRYMSPLGGGLAGAANVIMQLSWPAIGYGVAESRVESGSAMKHPLKRSRTTFTYLAVALFGNENDRAVFREAVNRQHAQVRSTETSPVPYNAFSPKLQLWVAACLSYGLLDLAEKMQGPLEDEAADDLYRYSACLGTTLQVRPEMWPPDRKAFLEYWEESLRQVAIDDTIRDYLMRLIRLENLPRVLQLLLARNSVFWTTGFLPPVFRDQMRLEWTDEDQRRMDRRLGRLSRIEGLMPVWLKVAPAYGMLFDMRLRQRLGLPLV